MFDNHTNLAFGVVKTPPEDALNGTEFVLEEDQGSSFDVNQPVTLAPNGVLPTGSNAEIGYITAISGDTITLTRAQEGSTARQIEAGWVIYGSITSKTLTDIEEAVSSALQSVIAGDNITIDATDPQNPVISAVPSSGLYDVVIPDNYATLSEALASVSNNTAIFIRPGTYTEAGGTFTQQGLKIMGLGASSILSMAGNLTLSGDNVSIESTTFDLTGGRKLTLSGSYSQLLSSSVINGTVAGFFTGGTYTNVSDNRIIASSTGGTIVTGQRDRWNGNHLTVPHTANGGMQVNFYTTFEGNFLYRQGVGSSGPLLFIWGERVALSGNSFFCANAEAISTDFRTTISGNSIFQGAGNILTVTDGCAITGNIVHINGPGVGIFINSSNTGYTASVNGNNISSNGAAPAMQTPQAGQTGILVNNGAQKPIISGNSVAGCAVGIDIMSDATGAVVSSNAISFFTTAISDNGTDTILGLNSVA